MLLLFTLFYCQEQPADVAKQIRKYCWVPGCSRRFALPSRGQASDTFLTFWRLHTFVYTLKILHINSCSLVMGICRHAFALKPGDFCKMSDIIGNARSQPLKAGYLGRAFTFPPYISQTSTLSLSPCHLDSVVRGNNAHQSQPATQSQGEVKLLQHVVHNFSLKCLMVL